MTRRMIVTFELTWWRCSSRTIMVVIRGWNFSELSKWIDGWSTLSAGIIIKAKINFSVVDIAACTPKVIKIESSDSFQLARCYFTDLSFVIPSSENIKLVTVSDGAAARNFGVCARQHNNTWVVQTFSIDKKRCSPFVVVWTQYKYSFLLNGSGGLFWGSNKTIVIKVVLRILANFAR